MTTHSQDLWSKYGWLDSGTAVGRWYFAHNIWLSRECFVSTLHATDVLSENTFPLEHFVIGNIMVFYGKIYANRLKRLFPRKLKNISIKP